MQLYPHQLKALDNTMDFNRVAYYLDMGLGKTFVGAEKVRQLNSAVNLIVCQKSKIEDWKEHFKKYYAYIPEFVYDLTDKGQLSAFRSHADAVRQNDNVENCYGVINYDLIFRRQELLQLEQFTLMLDESSMISNPSAKRTRFILKMQPDNVILLSGTPTGGKYEKLWSQLKLLGWDISKRTFYSHYVVQEWIENDSGFKIPIIVGYKNVDRLKCKLATYGAIFMKTEEVFDLPDQMIIPIKVKVSREYNRFMRNSIVEVEGVELIGDTKLTKLLYARQLCGSYNKDKRKAFEDMVSSTDDRLIVFYNFNKELDVLKQIALKYEKPISLVNGTTKELRAYETDDNSITFIQYQAGAMGLNLQKANKVIYYTLPLSSDLFEQSKKRIHRIGQNEKCFYYLMMCKNSIEEHIYETLLKRKDYDDHLFADLERGYEE